jgi:hypothetical protein
MKTSDETHGVLFSTAGVFRPAGQRLWKAIIRPDPLTGGDRGSGAVRHIGSFETEEEAAMAYDK